MKPNAVVAVAYAMPEYTSHIRPVARNLSLGLSLSLQSLAVLGNRIVRADAYEKKEKRY